MTLRLPLSPRARLFICAGPRSAHRRAATGDEAKFSLRDQSSHRGTRGAPLFRVALSHFLASGSVCLPANLRHKGPSTARSFHPALDEGRKASREATLARRGALGGATAAVDLALSSLERRTRRGQRCWLQGCVVLRRQREAKRDYVQRGGEYAQGPAAAGADAASDGAEALLDSTATARRSW